ncbi:TetR/AcrR family transcriptional regulator [Pseudonocardia humida]|uniref:TetR/AcrR family transcriptional regulator n=1 Tax=Pseudonocardia humida TaxID=2800819 RepID=A0ABT1A578_9PSEU|nr:TetR/AcrR family transcriptional regulator [Pseudonocardia humida]MCO1658171.1 TetR/AcrR family transcriptional regulator [Pseudonocardia humida]
MTERTDLVKPSDVRLERVLDAAAELLLRWGYQKVTIDEVARQAGIGKGTVYLHFPNKEALFLTVLLRAQWRSLAPIIGRIRDDAAEALPSRVLRTGYLQVAADPVLRALYLGDAEVLGRLTHEAAHTLGALAELRRRALRDHIALLREAGCLRTDLDVDAQVHVLQAVGIGFFFIDTLPGSPVEQAVRADLLAGTVSAALEVPDPPLDAVPVEAVIALYTPVLDQFREEWRRRVR